MRTLDPLCNPIVDPSASDPSAMPENSSPIHSQNDNSTSDGTNNRENNYQKEDTKEKTGKNSNSVTKGKDNSSVVVRRERPSRACTQRASARLQAAAEAEAEIAEAERKRKKARREKAAARALSKEESEEDGSLGMENDTVNGDENGEDGGSPSSSRLQCGKIITQLVGEVEPSQLPRWNIRNMWQLASIFNFLNVFRPLLNIKVEFSAEEFETALLNPCSILGDVHMPLLKAIPPVTRMALGHNTWVTVLCRKLRDWWHWVAEGDLPIVASHGTEIEAYNALDPSVRVVILKALCDIRVEQEDIRNYIDDSMKHGVHLSAFRRERIGGDSHGISYWYEDDPIIGHRLYREIRKVAIKRGKGRTVPQIPHSSYQWEVVATNLDEFVDVSEKLFSSKNRIEIAVGKKLKNDMLPEIEKVHKKKEKMLKKQHRQALMLDNMMIVDGLVAGRSLRDRKPVTYTFDDFDRSISEAIKVTKRKQSSPELSEKRDPHIKIEGTTNGSRWDGEPSHYPRRDSFTAVSPHSLDGDDSYDDQKTEADALGRSNRRRQKPQQYSVDDFLSADDSDNEPPDSDSDDDIVGEVVYDDEYLRSRKKRRKTTSTSDSEDEYRFDEETHEDEYKAEEDEDDEEDDDSSNSRDGSESDSPHKFKPGRAWGRAHRERHSRSVDELHSGLRRSKRSNRNRIDYRQYEMSDSENEKPDKAGGLAAAVENFDQSDDDSEENSDGESDGEGMHENGPALEENKGNLEKKNTREEEELSTSRDEEEEEGGGKRRFLDLNELAPGSGLDEGPTSTRGDEEEDDDDDEEEEG